MDRPLRVLGAVIIILAVIGGIGILSSVDWDSYNIAKEVYHSLPDNEFAKQNYLVEKNVVFPQVAFGIAIIFSGIVSGLFFLGLAAIIELLQKNEQNSQKIIDLIQQGAVKEPPATIS